MEDTSGSGDGGCFGAWVEDEDGLPCFKLAAAPDRQGLVLPEGGATAVWHLLGNDRMTVLAHAGGWFTLYATAGGFIRLTCGTEPREGSVWTLGDAGGRSLLAGPGDPSPEATWGIGYAEWTVESESLKVHRRASISPGDLPAMLVEIEVDGAAPSALTYTECWDFEPFPLLVGPLMSRKPAAGSEGSGGALRATLFVVSSAARSLTDAVRRRAGSRIDLAPRVVEEPRAAVLAAPAVPLRRTIMPKLAEDVFIAPLQGDWRLDIAGEVGGTRVTLEASVPRGAGTSRLSYAVGLAPSGRAEETIRRVHQALSDLDASPKPWKADVPHSPVLEREATWHAGYLRAAAVDDAAFQCRYVPQGSAYGFIHGGQGAPRDYAVTAAALAAIDPPLARDILRFMMRMTTPDGMTHYSHAGFGACLPGFVHHAPTDLALFLLWGLDEYVGATGDTGFLDESLPFYVRRGRAPHATVRQRILLAWHYLRERVGYGEHGMLRAGSGDWSDPISLMVPSGRAFHATGESGFNTSMGAYILPRAAALIEAEHPLEADRMRVFGTRLQQAMLDAWTGRWFLRGWDGRGSPMGAEHLFLDGQVWCLIGRVGTDSQRASLIEAIEERCGNASPIGHTILDRPHPVRLGILAPGEDCNGGVWAAINGLLAWGYALHDTELAWSCLQKQSLAAHARAYPCIWYGIWSGPDAYNSHYAARPGETFLHPATPMTEFPVMNSNAHAGPLLGLVKVQAAS